MILRRCNTCKKKKGLLAFHKNTNKRDGIEPICKMCANERAKTHYEKNKEEKLKKCKEYYDKNKERYSDYTKKYREENKDTIKSRKQKYYSTERGKLLHINSSCKRRKLVKNTNDGTITTEFLLKLAQETKYCIFTGIELNESNRHLDHIIPISRGGEHTANNVRFISVKANLLKGAKLDNETKLELFKVAK